MELLILGKFFSNEFNFQFIFESRPVFSTKNRFEHSRGLLMRTGLFRRLVALAILIVLSIVAMVIGGTVLSGTTGGVFLMLGGALGLVSGAVMAGMVLAHERARKKNIKILRDNIEKLQKAIDEVDLEQDRSVILKVTLLGKLQQTYRKNELQKGEQHQIASSSGPQLSDVGPADRVDSRVDEGPGRRYGVIEWIVRFFNPAEEDLFEYLKRKEKNLDEEFTRKVAGVSKTSLEVQVAHAHLKELKTPGLKKVQKLTPMRDRSLSFGADQECKILEGEVKEPEKERLLGDSEPEIKGSDSDSSSSEKQIDVSMNRRSGL